MREVIVIANIPEMGGTFSTVPVILDQYIAPFQVSFSTSVDGNAELSYTDPFPVDNQDFVEANFDWLPIDPNYPNGDNYLGLPARAIRLSGATEGAIFTVIQSGVKG